MSLVSVLLQLDILEISMVLIEWCIHHQFPNSFYWLFNLFFFLFVNVQSRLSIFPTPSARCVLGPLFPGGRADSDAVLADSCSAAQDVTRFTPPFFLHPKMH